MPSIISIAHALSAAVTLASAIPHSGHSHMHLHARSPGQSNNGACGGDLGFTCAPGYCCSSWGYCGKSPAYCGNGCQSEYGTCSGGGSSASKSASAAATSKTVVSVKAAQTVTVSPVAGASTLTAKTAYHSHSSWAGAPGWSSSSASSPAESSAESSAQPASSSVWTSSSAVAAPSTTLLTSTLPSAATTYSPTSTVVPASSAPAPSSYSAPASSSSSAPASSPSSGGGSGSDTYKLYSGDGTTSAGWPSQNDWVSWDSMWSNNLDVIKISCTQFGQSNNSDDENDQLQQAIQDVANSASMDPRFVLAVVMQESKGCVRAPTTNYGVTNPGLMQSHDGTGSCNNGAVQDPCPSSEITQMIKDGTTGTAAGDGLQQTMTQCGATDVSKYYKAARMYNSGSIAASGNLDDGIATHCYASDIANRLTGWVKAQTACNLD